MRLLERNSDSGLVLSESTKMPLPVKSTLISSDLADCMLLLRIIFDCNSLYHCAEYATKFNSLLYSNRLRRLRDYSRLIKPIHIKLGEQSSNPPSLLRQWPSLPLAQGFYAFDHVFPLTAAASLAASFAARFACASTMSS